MPTVARITTARQGLEDVVGAETGFSGRRNLDTFRTPDVAAFEGLASDELLPGVRSPIADVFARR